MEFELVGYGTSRIAGYIMHEGQAYMTCDLGFLWNRMEPGMLKSTLNLIYVFKRWHHDAETDGRGLLRIDGKLYKVQFTRVTDPLIDQALKDQLEVLATEFVAPMKLGPLPKAPPNDIWFFKMDSRT